MIRFILNNESIHTDAKSSGTLLDFIRYNKQLKGTKIGCREGDCGACTVLVGSIISDKLVYRSATSCITPLGNVEGKHVVSVEGINGEDLRPYQEALVETSGTQCGFCTVGFIMSFAGACLENKSLEYEEIISAVDGNICRCTGYKSIERAAKIIHEGLERKDRSDPINWLVNENYIPSYFLDIPTRLAKINDEISKTKKQHENGESVIILGGGTDLLVQKHDDIYESSVNLISNNSELTGIEEANGYVLIHGATNTTELLESEIMKGIFPKLWQHLKLVSSTPIRNIGLVAGNFVNASPIGDLTAFFIALNAEIELKSLANNSRWIYLKDFYKGYKDLDMSPDEYISQIRFKRPGKSFHFNFEKISKRRYLDIATVNTALMISVNDNTIDEIYISAGGVGPIPKFLTTCVEYLNGKKLNTENISAAADLIEQDISPISDVRGSKAYKSFLLRQLFLAHFIELFPKQFKIEFSA